MVVSFLPEEAFSAEGAFALNYINCLASAGHITPKLFKENNPSG